MSSSRLGRALMNSSRDAPLPLVCQGRPNHNHNHKHCDWRGEENHKTFWNGCKNDSDPLSVPLHKSAIGDTTSCDAPCGAIGFRGKLSLSLRCPPPRPVFGLRYAISAERSGGVAAIACDTTENTVRQGCCYTCLATGRVFRSGH